MGTTIDIAADLLPAPDHEAVKPACLELHDEIARGPRGDLV